jgi:hypothetical protein
MGQMPESSADMLDERRRLAFLKRSDEPAFIRSIQSC